MSLALATRGYVFERITQLVTTSDALVLVSATPHEQGITLAFNLPPVVTNASPASWPIVTESGAPGPAVSGLSVLNNTVIIQTSEHRPNVRYRLTIPPGGLSTASSGPYVGVMLVEYLGMGTSPSILSIVSEDPTHILVTYSEPIEEASMVTLSNYVVYPRLKLVGITWVSATQVRLTTIRQAPGVLYQLTVSNIKDLGGNPLVLST